METGRQGANPVTQRQRSLSATERAIIRWKTDGRCHICGGALGKKWTADHIVARARGGRNTVENYLPACKVCNRLRWHYEPEEIRQILQLGIYARNAIEHRTDLGKMIEKLYVSHVSQNKHRKLK